MARPRPFTAYLARGGQVHALIPIDSPWPAIVLEGDRGERLEYRRHGRRGADAWVYVLLGQPDVDQAEGAQDVEQ